MDQPRSLLDLPESLLLGILQYCPSVCDLIHLSETSQSLRKFMSKFSKDVWKELDVCMDWLDHESFYEFARKIAENVSCIRLCDLSTDFAYRLPIFPNVTTLKCSGSYSNRDCVRIVHIFADTFPAVKNLMWNSDDDFTGMVQVLERWPNLTGVSIGCSIVLPAGTDLPALCYRIGALEICKVPRLFGLNCDCFEHLVLGATAAATAKADGGGPVMRELSLNACGISLESFQAVEKLGNLRVLEINKVLSFDTPPKSNPVLPALPALSHLSVLSLSGVHCSESDWLHLWTKARFSLTVLSTSLCDGISDAVIGAMVFKQPRIRVLCIYAGGGLLNSRSFGNPAIECLTSGLKELRYLSLCGRSTMTHDCWRYFSGNLDHFRKLKFLCLNIGPLGCHKTEKIPDSNGFLQSLKVELPSCLILHDENDSTDILERISKIPENRWDQRL